jgi:hypothetical protein
VITAPRFVVRKTRMAYCLLNFPKRQNIGVMEYNNTVFHTPPGQDTFLNYDTTLPTPNESYIPQESTSRKQSIEYSESRPNKRTRASPDQLIQLEATFSSNPSPTLKVREMLSDMLKMNERSIQIWFQV